MSPACTRLTFKDISCRSPENSHRQFMSWSVNPMSKLPRPVNWSTTSVTVPSFVSDPLSISRVDHSWSHMVWCNRAMDWSTEDLPEALVPQRSVKGASGSLNNSKHLNVLRSSWLSTENLPEHDTGRIKPMIDPYGVVCSISNGCYEIIIFHQYMQCISEIIRSGFDDAWWEP